MQMMDLLDLAPDAQEFLSFLPATTTATTRSRQRQLVAMAAWDEQRKLS